MSVIRPMRIAYGPPGHKGVTHLMAVGADEYPPSQAEELVGMGAVASAGLLLVGILTGRRRVFDVALGAAIATIPAYVISRRTRRVSAV